MENDIPRLETPQSVSGVRWKQSTAAVLFVLTYVLNIIVSFAPQLFYVIPIGNGDLTYMSATAFTYPLFMLCAFLLLRPLSANRIVRLVTLVLAIAFGLVLAVRVLAFLVFSPDSIESLGTHHSISGFANICLTFAFIFSLACILKNCTQLLGSAHVWAQFILCVTITNIMDFIYNFMLGTIPEGIDIMQVSFNIGLFYGIFNALMFILLAIAYYKFAKSDLFCGVFDDSPAPAGVYSIVNKYWAAVLVVIVLFTVAMYLVLSNADKLLYS
jgi:hypothetical protein